jgi:CDP-glycerol glycerophosphotransferase
MSKIKDYIYCFIAYYLTRLYAWIIPENKNRFLFYSMGGNNYGDSVKCLSDYIEKNYEKAQIIWAFSKYYYDKVDCDHKKVIYGSFRYYYYVISSKYYITNCYAPLMMIKRKGQIMMQTWHGTALKRIGYDGQGGDHNRFVDFIRPNTYKAGARDIDFFVSGSSFMTSVYHRALKYPKEIMEIGTPRNDIFFQNRPDVFQRVKVWAHVDSQIKLILYTPTFRPDFSFKYYDVDLCAIKHYYEELTKENYVVLVRLHPRMMSKSAEVDNLFVKEGIVNVTLYPDIQDLLYAADVLVTDYSSTMFDFMLSMKPVILYTPDKETYNRGFYFDIEELPFIIANNNAELLKALQNFESNEYVRKVNQFLERIGNAETGHATESAYQLLVDGRKTE